MNNTETKIAIFKGKKIRKTIYQKEWWFSVVDVIEVLTGSINPRDYWFKMKIRVQEEDGFQPSTICRQLKMQAPDGKMRETDCANTEGVFRIIQSIPSPKAEPFNSSTQTLLSVAPTSLLIFPASHSVIPAPHSVIPAKAGIQT